ncbi:transcriptional regulator, partial [Bacillus wiedmannii]
MNQAFKALADPTRRKILDLLKDSDLTAGEIAEH